MSGTIFPFQRLFRDLVMQVSEFRIDGDLVPEELVDEARHIIQVRAVGRETWTSADVDVIVEFPVQEVMTRGIADDKMSVLLQLACNATDLRATERLKVRDGKARGKISFKRDLVADRVTVTAILCEEGADGIPRILKESRPWDLVITATSSRSPRPPRPPGPKGLLLEIFDVRWRSFEQEADLKQYANELYFIDVGSPDRPAIYLNEDIDSYAALLSDRPGSSAQEKAMRDLEFRRVSLAAWFAAVLHALEGVTIDEQTEDLSLPDGWRHDVLELILRRYRPNQSTEMTARSIARGRSDGEGYALLLGQLQNAINQMLDVTSVLRRHLSLIGQRDAEAGSDE